MSRAAGVAVTVLLTVLAGWAGWVVATNDVPDALPVGDRVQAAVEALRESNIYIAPDSADLLSGDDLARLEKAAAASSPETFVMVWESSSEGGFYLDSEGVRQVGAELGRPGYYVSIGRDGVGGSVSSDDVGIDGDYVNADGFAEGEAVTQQSVAARLTEIIAESNGREFSEASTTGSAYWGGTGGTIAAGILMGAVAGAPLTAIVVVAWFIVRSRTRSRA